MRQPLPPILSRTGSLKKRRQLGSTLCLFALFFFVSHSAAALENFKGGYATYVDLGNGRYDIITVGFWHKDKVASTSNKYEGWPKLESANQTVSKTLLSDGETVQHIQKQTVSWSTPGLYKVYWGKCCWGEVANYANSIQGMSFSINYDPQLQSSSPRFRELPFFNFSAGQAIEYRMGLNDPDGHEQEFSLVAPYFGTTAVYEEMLASGFRIKPDGTIQWDKPVAGRWLVTVRAAEKINGTLTGAFISWEIILNVHSTESDQPPFLKTIAPKMVSAGGLLHFEVEATDDPHQDIQLTAIGPTFDKGASFVQTSSGSMAKGVYSWQVPLEAAGSYYIQFLAANRQNPALISQHIVPVEVVVCGEFTPQYSILTLPCPGSKGGQISLTPPAAGNSPYQYSLNNGHDFQSSPDFTQLAPGQYTGLVVDAAGCTSHPVTIALEEAPLPELTFSLPSTICADAAELSLNGGSPAGGTYEGTGVEGGIFYPQRAGAGTHSITYRYTNEQGCSNTTTAKITVNDALVASAGPEQVVVASNGNSNGGGTGYGSGNGNNKGKGAENGVGHTRSCATLSGEATGGSGPYAYQWSNGETSQTISVCPAETTTYQLTVTDAQGCTTSSQTRVVVESPSATGNSGSAQNAATGVTAFPNPLTPASQLMVRLPVADQIIIEITDLSGYVVKKLYTGAIEAQQTMSFELGNKLGHQKIYIARVSGTKGVYHCRLMLK